MQSSLGMTMRSSIMNGWAALGPWARRMQICTVKHLCRLAITKVFSILILQLRTSSFLFWPSAAFPRSSQNRQAGNLTPRTINSLTVIAAEHGHEGEDEDWEREMHGWRNDEDVRRLFHASVYSVLCRAYSPLLSLPSAHNLTSFCRR